jgi:hypothetical protein
VGFDLLMRSVAEAGTVAHTMDLAVDLDERHAFISFTPPIALATVLKSVHTLTLRDAYCPFFTLESVQTREPRVIITKALCPALQSLTIDHDACSLEGYDRVAAMPSPSDCPDLRSLTIVGTDNNDETLRSYLLAYGCNLQHLALDLVDFEDYGSTLEVARLFNLDTLEIHHLEECFWHDYFHHTADSGESELAERILNNLPKDKHDWPLQDVLMGPPMFRKSLERYWDGGETTE